MQIGQRWLIETTNKALTHEVVTIKTLDPLTVFHKTKIIPFKKEDLIREKEEFKKGFFEDQNIGTLSVSEINDRNYLKIR